MSGRQGITGRIDCWNDQEPDQNDLTANSNAVAPVLEMGIICGLVVIVGACTGNASRISEDKTEKYRQTTKRAMTALGGRN